MIYISKGTVQAKSTEQLLHIYRGNQSIELTGLEAKLWLGGRFEFSEATAPAQLSALVHLSELGLVETSEENSAVAKYRMLTQCVLCAAETQKFIITEDKVGFSVLNWVRNAGIHLSLAELVYLHEHDVRPTVDLLYTENRQALIETIYTRDTIFDNILECQMEHAACRDEIVAAIMTLLKHKKIILL